MNRIVLLLTLAVVPLAARAQITISDDFSGYAQFSDAYPKWDADTPGWEVVDGRYANNGLGGTALIGGQPRFRQATVEATVTVQQSLGLQWKVAAVSLTQSQGNKWHVGLVEGPDPDKRHFVELGQGYHDAWPTRAGCQQTASEGADFVWQYDTPYRLRLVLTPEGIDGQVLDMTGKLLWRQAVSFVGPCVRDGRPGLYVGSMKASYDDVRLEASMPVEEAAPEAKTFPPYDARANGPFTSKATGFFRTEQRDGRWWLVDPKGNAFYAVGTDHCRYFGHGCQTLGYSPYQRNNEAKYKSRVEWAILATDRLKSWNFNLLGAGNDQDARYRGLAHTDFLSFGSGFSPSDDIVEKTTWTGFPNVFSPKWPAYCDKLARRRCEPQKNDPWLFGYFLDNELEWYGKAHVETGLFDEAMKKPADHTAKIALVDQLKAKYATIADFNAAWGQKLASFEDIPKLDSLSGTNSDTVKADKLAYTRLVAENYFKYTTEAIRRYDPNHLIIGCRFAGNAPAGIWDINGKYCDVVTFNSYPRVDMKTGDLSDLAKLYTGYFEMSQKPMMITEWSFPALDSGLPCKHGAGMRVDTQAQKAECYRLFQSLMFRLPFMVGSDYFMWVDEPALGISDTFPEDSNYGLVDEKDNPWPELTAMATRVNAQVAEMHAGKLPDLSVDEGWLVRNKGEGAATFVVRTYLDGNVSDQTVSLGPGESRTFAPQIPEVGGAHLAAVEVDPDRTTADLNRADNIRTQTVWKEPVPVPAALRGRPLAAISVANWSGSPAPSSVATVKVDALPAALQTGPAGSCLRIMDLAGAEPPQQDDGDEIAFSVGTLNPWEARQYLVYRSATTPPVSEPIAFSATRDATTASVSNGQLRLAWDLKATGNVYDTLSLDGAVLGSYNPLVWQEVGGQNQWTRATGAPADAENARRVKLGAVRCVMDVTTRGGEGRPITAVDDQGKQEVQQARPPSFEVTHRLVIYPNVNWMQARLVSIKNTSDRALTINGYFFYLNGLLGGSADGDKPAGPDVPNYYSAAGSAWADANADLAYGALAMAPAITTNFWLDNGGAQHPDARAQLETPVVLQPGETYRDSREPWLLIYGAKSADKPWSKMSALAAQLSAVKVDVRGL
jgi:hypothetical protein